MKLKLDWRNLSQIATICAPLGRVVFHLAKGKNQRRLMERAAIVLCFRAIAARLDEKDMRLEMEPGAILLRRRAARQVVPYDRRCQASADLTVSRRLVILRLLIPPFNLEARQWRRITPRC